MNVLSAYPLITTQNPQAVRDFYVKHFGFDVIFKASWVVMLGLPGSGDVALGVMTPDHPTNPPGPEVFGGKGMIVTIQVEDAAEAIATLKKTGAPIGYDLHEEPWGQRRFMTRDPAGTLVDVVEQTEPAEGWWDRYMNAEGAAA